MAFVKKTWKDRLVEYAGRRKITNTTTNESQIVDVERAEGQVSEEGSAFSAANMNDLEQRVADEFTELNKKTDEISNDMGGNILTYNESEDAYYIQYGADSVPKKLGSELIDITNYATLNGGTGTLANGVYEALPSELIIPCSGYDNISFTITPSWYALYWIYDNNGNTLASKTSTGATAKSFSTNISSISYLRIVVKDTHIGSRDGQFGQVNIMNLVMK